MGARGSKAVRVIAVVLASLLYACTQPPEVPDDELFDCELSQDGKFLVCHDRKQTRVAHD